MFVRARRRLMLLNVAVLLVIILVLGATILLLIDRMLLAVETQGLRSDVAAAADWARDTAAGRTRPPPHGGEDIFYVVWDTQGQVLSDPDRVAGPRLRTQAMEALKGDVQPIRVDLPGDRDALVGAEAVRGAGGVTAVVQVGRSLTPLETVEHEALLVVGLASAGAVLLSLLAGWFLAGRALVPIRGALERQRRFAADASHELRTPLTVIDAGLQVLLRQPSQRIEENADVLQSMSAETQRMERLLGSLLALARADSGEAELRLVRTDVEELLRTAARDFAPLASERRARIELHGDHHLLADLDPDRIRQLLLILLDNALTHAPPGTDVRVSWRGEDDELVLEVSDRGPGIPAAERERVFQRFHQVDASRTGKGAGLGLAIARWIVTAHRGRISLDDNRPGLRVRVRLPLTRRLGQLARLRRLR